MSNKKQKLIIIAAILILAAFILTGVITATGIAKKIEEPQNTSGSNQSPELTFQGSYFKMLHNNPYARDDDSQKDSPPRRSLNTDYVKVVVTVEYLQGCTRTFTINPSLTFSISDLTAALGTLSSAAVSKDSTTFTVATNADSGYVVDVSGNTLTSGSDTIDAMTSAATSSPGTEQFGINLKDNSVPDVGAEPSGGSGAAASGYDTANNFKFVSGNTIASCSGSSDTTTFTISYIANITSATEAGDYTTTLILIATGKY